MKKKHRNNDDDDVDDENIENKEWIVSKSAVVAVHQTLENVLCQQQFHVHLYVI